MTQISYQQASDRIEDWVSRLNLLYDMLDDWVTLIPHDRVERKPIQQTIEPFMRQSGIAPRDVPMYTIFHGKKRIAFVPSVLWAPGTNGRINIATNKKQHILIDRGDSDHGSKWRLVVDDFKRLLVPFNKTEFAKLMAEGE
jgi:hypothetical protein